MIVSLGTDEDGRVIAVIVGLTGDDLGALLRGEFLTSDGSNGIRRVGVLAGHSNDALIRRVAAAGNEAGVESVEVVV